MAVRRDIARSPERLLPIVNENLEIPSDRFTGHGAAFHRILISDAQA